jgi:hypothetical protein
MDLSLIFIGLQFLSYFGLGFAIGNSLLWLKETKFGKYVIGIFLIPFLLWAVYVLSKDDFLAKIADKIEREKITYYFPSD